MTNIERNQLDFKQVQRLVFRASFKATSNRHIDFRYRLTKSNAFCVSLTHFFTISPSYLSTTHTILFPRTHVYKSVANNVLAILFIANNELMGDYF